MNALQLLPRQRPQFVSHLVLAGSQRHQSASLNYQNFCVGDGFGRERMLVVGFETKDVAGQVEGSDLTAPIGENLVGAHCALYDLVHVVRRFVLSKDFRVAAERDCGAHQVYRIAKTAAGYLRLSWQIVCCSAGETSADCVLCQHGLTSRRM